MNVIEELKRLAAADSTPEATRLVLIEAIVRLSQPEPIPTWPVQPMYPTPWVLPWTPIGPVTTTTGSPQTTWTSPTLTFKLSDLPRLQPHIHIPRGVPDPLTEEQAEDWH